jgi:hypothetical protein
MGLLAFGGRSSLILGPLLLVVKGDVPGVRQGRQAAAVLGLLMTGQHRRGPRSDSNDTIGVNVVSDQRVIRGALGSEDHRLTQPPTHRPKENAQQIEPLLALEFLGEKSTSISSSVKKCTLTRTSGTGLTRRRKTISPRRAKTSSTQAGSRLGRPSSE